MKKPHNISVKRRVKAIFVALSLPALLIMSFYAFNAMETVKTKLARAAGSSLQLFAASLENQMEAVENHLIDLALRSEELRRLGEEENHTQAYLDAYEITQGFSSIIDSNEAVSGMLLYSTDNDMYMASYGALPGNALQQGAIRLAIQEHFIEFVSTGPLDAYEWFAYSIKDTIYWLRIVRYRGVYTAAAINLDLLYETAISQYEFDGALSFWDNENALILGENAVSSDKISWKSEEYGEVTWEGQHYLCVSAQADMLQLSYLLPFEETQGAMGHLEIILVICTILALISSPLIAVYLRRTILQPLDSLVVTMEKIAAGELEARPSTIYKSKEFEQVNDTFNNMISQITRLKIDTYEKQLAAERSEMEALKMQIRPHFIQNCLKNVYALAQTGRIEEIQALILMLSRHLRYVLSYPQDTVLLSKELELCQNYLELSGVGQAYPARCNVKLDPRLKDLPVPPVSLLTLVENCAKHGVRGDTELVVTITARQLEMEQGTLADIAVEDNGPGFSAAQMEQLNRNLSQEDTDGHIGLANVIRRFQLLYGEEVAVAFTNGRNGGAHIEIFLPLREEVAKEEIHETADRG